MTDTSKNQIVNRVVVSGYSVIQEIERIVRSKYIREDLKKEFNYLVEAAKTCIITSTSFKDYCKRYPRKE